MAGISLEVVDSQNHRVQKTEMVSEELHQKTVCLVLVIFVHSVSLRLELMVLMEEVRFLLTFHTLEVV